MKCRNCKSPMKLSSRIIVNLDSGRGRSKFSKEFLEQIRIKKEKEEINELVERVQNSVQLTFSPRKTRSKSKKK